MNPNTLTTHLCHFRLHNNNTIPYDKRVYNKLNTQVLHFMDSCRLLLTKHKK